MALLRKVQVNLCVPDSFANDPIRVLLPSLSEEKSTTLLTVASTCIVSELLMIWQSGTGPKKPRFVWPPPVHLSKIFHRAKAMAMLHAPPIPPCPRRRKPLPMLKPSRALLQPLARLADNKLPPSSDCITRARLFMATAIIKEKLRRNSSLSPFHCQRCARQKRQMLTVRRLAVPTKLNTGRADLSNR